MDILSLRQPALKVDKHKEKEAVLCQKTTQDLKESMKN